MNTSDELVLRSLDPAEPILNPEQQRRAEDLLERLLATPIPSGDTKSSHSSQHPWRTRKLAWVAAAAAAVRVASVVFPGVGGSGVSYASWTATPSTVAAHDVEVVSQACRDKVRDARSGPGGAQLFDPAKIPVELAERRGDFVAILFLQENPYVSLTCVAINRPGSTDVDNVNASVGGSDGPAWTPPPGQIRRATVSQFGGRSPASFTDGAVGEDVVAVTILPAPRPSPRRSGTDGTPLGGLVKPSPTGRCHLVAKEDLRRR